MTERKDHDDAPSAPPRELSEEQLEQASGAFNPQPDPPGRAATKQQTLNIGSQSAGAGAGRVTFNP